MPRAGQATGTLTLRVTVHGETVELDVPPLVVQKLQAHARERGVSAQALAGQLIERGIARDQAQKSPEG